MSNLGITQRCADQMVVVGKIEGKRPKFPPLIGLGQVNKIAAADHTSRPGSQAPVCTTLTLNPAPSERAHQGYIRTKPTYKVRNRGYKGEAVVGHSSFVTTPRPCKVLV